MGQRQLAGPREQEQDSLHFFFPVWAGAGQVDHPFQVIMTEIALIIFFIATAVVDHTSFDSTSRCVSPALVAFDQNRTIGISTSRLCYNKA